MQLKRVYSQSSLDIPWYHFISSHRGREAFIYSNCSSPNDLSVLPGCHATNGFLSRCLDASVRDQEVRLTARDLVTMKGLLGSLLTRQGAELKNVTVERIESTGAARKRGAGAGVGHDHGVGRRRRGTGTGNVNGAVAGGTGTRDHDGARAHAHGHDHQAQARAQRLA